MSENDRVCVSYSGTNLYESCPSAFNRRYVIKQAGKFKVSPAMQRGTDIHYGIEQFLLGLAPLPEEAHRFEALLTGMLEHRAPRPEVKFAFNAEWEATDFEDKEASAIRGVMDCCYYHDDMAYVFEWKTGKKYADHAGQRVLYGLAGLLMYPKVDFVKVQTVYIDNGKVDELVIHRDRMPTQLALWTRKIERCQPPQKYPQTPSWKCGGCQFNHKNGGKCDAL